MNFLKNLLVQLCIGVNVATLIMLWSCCAITYLSPVSYPYLSLFTLTFPFLLVLNILFIFFWLIFKIRYVWIPLVGLIVCFSFIRDYIPINLPSNPPNSTLKVISYNTNYYGQGSSKNNVDSILTFLKNNDADIICLQESGHNKSFEDSLCAAGYEHFGISTLQIFSRLHIISAEKITMNSRNNHCMRAYLEYGLDTIMIINQHFESNHLSPEIKEAYREALENHQKDSLRKDLEPIINKLAVAAPYRAMQTDSIYRIIESWLPRPLILCSDFNDTPVSYTHRRLTTSLKDAFRESANGLGFTYHEKGFPVRIDFILYNGKIWKSYDTYVDRSIRCSDHFPILTKLGQIDLPK